MEGISRKDLDKAIEVLRKHNFVDIADKIEKFDIIPKLYVYAYVKSVKNMLDELHNENDDKKIDPESFIATIEERDKLQLDFLNDSSLKSNIKKLDQFIHNAFERENQFCDFDDSRYHSQKKFGKCECDSHDEYADEDGQREEYELSPVYFDDESTHKWTDEPEWWCEHCSSDCDACDFDVSCDLDVD